MFRQSNRLFKLLDKVLTPLVLLLFFVQKKKLPVSRAPQRVLIVKLCCFGDALLSLLSIKALKERLPFARITVLASERSAEVFRYCAFVDDVEILHVSGTKGKQEFLRFFELIGLIKKLRASRFDLFLDYDVYYRFTEFIGFYVNAGFSAGFVSFKGRGRLYTHKVERSKDGAEWQLFFELLRPLGIEKTDKLGNAFRFEPNQALKALDLIGQNTGSSLWVGIMMGGSPNWPEKRWPIGHFAGFMKQLNAFRPTNYFLFGLPAEQTLAAELKVLYHDSSVIDLTGKTPFPVLYHAISALDLFVSNDTGPMHLSALIGVPTVGIFGPTNQLKWSPPGPFSAVYLKECACRPCYFMSRMPECDHLECLKSITPEQVLFHAKALLERK